MNEALQILALVVAVAVVAAASRRLGLSAPLVIVVVGAVVFTTVLVGLVAWAVIPGVSPAGAFALGAVVSPPDAVAATTIARKVGMPRRIVAILEGESLLNDATA